MIHWFITGVVLGAILGFIATALTIFYKEGI